LDGVSRSNLRLELHRSGTNGRLTSVVAAAGILKAVMGEPTAVLVDFIERWMLDRDRGAPLSSEDYESRYPGFEAAIRAEYARLSATANGAAQGHEVEEARGVGRFGAYELVRLVGEGSQGSVYEAVDVRLRRRVALKVLNGFESPSALRRFHREAELVAALDHPALCTLYETGAVDGRAFIAMRFVEGRSLADLLREGRDRGPGPIALPGAPPTASLAERTTAVVRAAALIARAVACAHESGVVHRDVKPANIVVDAEGRPVVLDFGLARSGGGDAASLTQAGDLLGTPAYLAPEHVAGKPVDARGDVYAIGVTLYECLTGRRPFEAPTRAALFKSVLEDAPPDPRPRNPAIGRDLLAVLETALAKDPDRRYATATALADDLDAVAENRPVTVRRASVAARLLSIARRRRAAAAVVVLAAIAIPVIAALGGYIAARRPDVAFAEEKRREIQDELDLLAAYHAFEYGARPAAAPMFEKLAASPYVAVEAIAGAAIALLRDDQPREALAALDRAPAGTDSPGLAILRRRALAALGLPIPPEVEASAERPPREAVDLFLAGKELLDGDIGDGVDPEPWERAYRLLTRAVTHPRARPRYQFERARVFAFLGARRPEEAREAAEFLQEHWPESGAAWHRSGLALSQVDFEASQRAYARAKELTPGDSRVVMEKVRRMRRAKPKAASQPTSQPTSQPASRPESAPAEKRSS
jgi:serine/threonine protein kinase